MKIESDMIPDKIYIPKNLAPHLTEEWASHTHGSIDEYIRKDTLIEFVNKELQESADRLDFRTNKAYAEVINKINSM